MTLLRISSGPPHSKDTPAHYSHNFSSERLSGTNFPAADGSVKIITETIGLATCYGLCTRRGREVLGEYGERLAWRRWPCTRVGERKHMARGMEGRVALVTGASRGIGRAICVALGQAGAVVVAVARTAEQIEAVASEIVDAGGQAIALRADVAVESDVCALFDQLRARFGRLDVLINNAGLGRYGPVEQFAAADFDQVMAVNLRGVFLCCQEAARMMIPQGSGYIINISSVVGFKGYPLQSAYTAAKHGVMGLTKSLAAELHKHGIRVSAVLPGGVDTDMARSARPDLDPADLLQPDDVAQTVMYLLSLSDRAAVDQVYLRRRSSQPF